MASSRKPGPLGAEGVVPDIQDGTMVRAASPIPGSVSPSGNSSAPVPRFNPTRPRKSYKGLPTLRKGAHNKHVRWLQVQLNQQNAARPTLKADAYFGPKTLAAVINFQRSVRLSPDGVVGLQTWLKVAVTKKGSQQTTTQPANQPASVKSSTPAPVADWSLSRRFEEVLKLAPNHMAPELAAQFRAMLTPVNLGIIAATLAAWAISHAFGVGEVVDIVLLAVGTVFLGMAVLGAAEDIRECVTTTLDAETQPDLDKAADYLAQAVAILGVVAFFSLLARVGAELGRAPTAGEDDAALTSARTARDSVPQPRAAEAAGGPTNTAPEVGVTGAKDVRTISAEEANAPFVKRGWSPPYAEGTQVKTFTSSEDTTFVRVHGPDNQQGAFVVRYDDIKGMNAEQIQQHLALPYKPSLVSDVNVPAGTRLQGGTVGAQPEFGASKIGGTQYQILDKLPASSFSNTRPLP